MKECSSILNWQKGIIFPTVQQNAKWCYYYKDSCNQSSTAWVIKAVCLLSMQFYPCCTNSTHFKNWNWYFVVARWRYQFTSRVNNFTMTHRFYPMDKYIYILPSWVDFLIFLSLNTCKNVLPAIFPIETWVLSVRDFSFSRIYPTKKNLGPERQVRLPTCPILSISNYQSQQSIIP